MKKLSIFKIYDIKLTESVKDNIYLKHKFTKILLFKVACPDRIFKPFHN